MREHIDIEYLQALLITILVTSPLVTTAVPTPFLPDNISTVGTDV